MTKCTVLQLLVPNLDSVCTEDEPDPVPDPVPVLDYGWELDLDGNLTPSGATTVDPAGGWELDTEGNLVPSGVSSTVGFWLTTDGNLIPNIP